MSKAAAGLLLIAPTGRILLAERSRSVGSGGLWSTPGGGLEPGEDELTAAAREVYEELALNLHGEPFHQRFATETRSGKGRVYTTFVMDVTKEYKVIPANYETESVGWFTIEEAFELPLHGLLRPVLVEMVSRGARL